MNTQTRMIVAMALCAIIYIVFDFLQPRPSPQELAEAERVAAEQAALQAGETQKDGAAAGEGAPSRAPSPPGADADLEGEPDPAQPEVEIITHEIRNDSLALQVTNRAPGTDGILAAIELLDAQFQGHATATDPFRLGGMRTLELSFADEATDFRLPKRAAYAVRRASNSQITLGYADDSVDVEAMVELLTGYEGRLTVTVTNKTRSTQAHRLHLRTRIGAGEGSSYDIRRGLCHTSEDMEYEDLSDVEDGPIHYGPAVWWGGVDSKYFVQAVLAQDAMTDCEISGASDQSYLVNHLATAAHELDDGASITHTFGLYIGPKQLESLQAFGAIKSEGVATLPDAIDWGLLGGVSEGLGKLLLGLLRWFHGLVGNWGIAIVLLTLLVKVVTLPLTLKQMASMKRMKEIQPEMAKIKEKYSDDRAKQTQEMQALFSRSGVNPLAGCLPMLVQLPIWFALYSMLSAAVELVHVPFLWLPDLTQQDPVYILPLALGGLMILQHRMMPTSSMGDETQAKMMRWVMPIMFTVFMLFLPSGLGIYIFANILLSIAQTAIQVGTNKQAEPAAAS